MRTKSYIPQTMRSGTTATELVAWYPSVQCEWLRCIVAVVALEGGVTGRNETQWVSTADEGWSLG